MNPDNIPVPERMQRFPRWRGYPIHYTVWRDPTTGEPNFRVMHEPRRVECFKKNWCHLCGRNLGAGPYCFIGGPKCVAQGAFIDGPMHRDCAEYAARVCPFLSSPTGKYSSEVACEIDGELVTYESVPNLRPPKMALVVAGKYQTVRNPGRQRANPTDRGPGLWVASPPPPAPHAADPSGSAQIVFLVGNILEVIWDLMPQSKDLSRTRTEGEDDGLVYQP
jgi:hypothetical protein